jgi:prevent-host-death family protein
MAMSVSEARGRLPELIERVAAGEEVTLTRHGVAVAVLVRADALRTRRAAYDKADELAKLMRDASGRRLSRRGRLSAQRAEELVAEIDRDRGGR